MKWSEKLAEATKQLRSAGIDESELNAELLAASVMQVWNRSEVRVRLGNEISSVESGRFDQLLNRRLQREPLQYIVGETEFYGLRLFTTNAALIPRPETEILVEEVLKELRSRASTSPRVLDIGTGTGAIALALAAHLPNAVVVGIDISKDAIALATKNQGRLHLTNVAFKQADVFSDLAGLGSFDAIVSNPPYISITEIAELEPELREHEPHNALTDGNDGLSFYRRIAELAPVLLKQNGFLAVEIGHGADDKVSDIMRHHKIAQLRLVSDLAGIPRVWLGELSNSLPAK